MPLPNTTPCGAKTRRGTPCLNPAMRNGRCAKHGGKTPVGMASPHIKTGRYSRDLPTRLEAKYQETANDPELLSLRDDIRLVDALIKEQLNRLETGESGDAWQLIRASVEALEVGMDREDYAGCRKALRSMRDVIDGRIAHYATETEILSGLEQRRKLVETEQKMTLAGERAISAERAMLFVGAIAGVLKARIDDPHMLASIQGDIASLLDTGDRT